MIRLALAAFTFAWWAGSVGTLIAAKPQCGGEPRDVCVASYEGR